MAVSNTTELLRLLYEAYGGFADKRYTKLITGRPFAVDGRSKRHFDAAGRLYGWFCQMFVDVIDQDTVKLSLSGSVPDGPLVSNWLSTRGAEKTNFGVEVIVRRGEEHYLTDLDTAFRAIVQPGARYTVPAYKHVCPHIAEQIKRLHQILAQAWT